MIKINAQQKADMAQLLKEQLDAFQSDVAVMEEEQDGSIIKGDPLGWVVWKLKLRKLILFRDEGMTMVTNAYGN